MTDNVNKNRFVVIWLSLILLIGAITSINLYDYFRKRNSQYINIRYAAIKALPKFGDSSIIPALKMALSEKSHILRLAMLEAIIELGDDSVALLVSEELNSKDNPFRILAATILNKLGVRSDALRYLALVNSEDQKLRITAIRILGEIGYKEALKELFEQAKDENAFVKRAAIESIGKLKAESAIPMLRDALYEGEDPKIRAAAVVALGRYKQHKVNEYLINSLSDKDSSVREYIMSELVESEDPAIVPEIIGLLKDYDSNIRIRACEAVGNLGNKSNIADLSPLLEDPSSKVRYYATKAIIKLRDRTITPMFLSAIESKSAFEKISAIICMGRFGDETAVPALEGLTGSKDNIRLFALAALYKLGRKDKLQLLLSALNDKDRGIREKAKDALFELTARYDSPLPRGIYKDNYINDKIKTISLLESIRDKAAVSSLQAYINDNNLFVRAYALKAIGELGRELAIMTMIKDLDEVEALPFIQASPFFTEAGDYSSAKDIISKYMPKLTDKDPEVKAHAIRVLAGTGGKSILKELEPFARDKNPIVRIAAIESLAGFLLPEYIPVFIKALKDKDKKVNFSAVMALSKYSPEYAAKIVPVLTRIAVGRRF